MQLMGIRILSVGGPFGENDRSRWLTVAALLERRSYAIGSSVQAPGAEPETHLYGSRWALDRLFAGNIDTIDKVVVPATDQFISDKPPILPTLVAGVFGLGRAIGLEQI